jgi:hypothetical protein
MLRRSAVPFLDGTQRMDLMALRVHGSTERSLRLTSTSPRMRDTSNKSGPRVLPVSSTRTMFAASRIEPRYCCGFRL